MKLASHAVIGQLTSFGAARVLITGDYAALASFGENPIGTDIAVTCAFAQMRAPELMFPIRGIDDYGTIISDAPLLDWIVTRGQLHPRMEIEATSATVKMTQLFLRDLDLSMPARLHATVAGQEPVEIQAVINVSENNAFAFIEDDTLPKFMTETVPCYQLARDVVGPAAIGLINQALATPNTRMQVSMAAMNEFLNGLD